LDIEPTSHIVLPLQLQVIN